MASQSVDLERLAERAGHALDAENLDVALELYQRLERVDPTQPEWPRQLSKVHRLADEPAAEFEALLRSAECHAARSEFIPALATCKMVLSLDPGHERAQVLLTRLEPDQSVSVDYSSESGDEGADPSANDSAALDELVLTNIVEGARPASIADATLEGVHEIPLDVVAAERPEARRAATGTRARREVDAEAESEIAEHLEESPLFASLSGAALAKLVRHVKLVRLPGGEVLFRQGDAAGAVYVVAHGAVVPIAEEEPRTRLGVLEQGEFFGEISLFTDQPRNATVEALVDTELLSIDRPVMWSLVRRHPEVLSVLLGFLRDRLIDRLVRTSPLFRIFSSTKRSVIARRFRFLEVADGHAVIEQHKPTEAVFILLSGHMDVVHEATEEDALHAEADGGSDEAPTKVLATLGPGELFGEMSLLWREPSLASVIARGKCWLLALPARSFQEMLEHHPQLAAMATTIAEERRNENQRTLRDALGHRDGKAGII